MPKNKLSHCEKCGAKVTVVKTTHNATNINYNERLRHCSQCKHSFTTYEVMQGWFDKANAFFEMEAHRLAPGTPQPAPAPPKSELRQMLEKHINSRPSEVTPQPAPVPLPYDDLEEPDEPMCSHGTSWVMGDLPYNDACPECVREEREKGMTLEELKAKHLGAV